MDVPTGYELAAHQEQGSSSSHQRQAASDAHQTSPSPRRAAGQSSAPPKIRRRNRLITSCLECRRRKLKCDKQHPCSNCTKFVRDCVFLAPALDPAAQLRLAEIKEKMGSLERTLEDDVARRAVRAGSSTSAEASYLAGGDSDDADSDIPEDERDLEPTSMALQDATYYGDADDDLMDLGVKVGKMRITDRMGGLFRPRLAHELAILINRRTDLQDVNSQTYAALTSDPSYGLGSTSIEAAVAPGADYVAPSSSFFFAPEPAKTSFLSYLPSRMVADRLLNQYWDAVHTMCKVVHRPSFERQYVSFWQDVAAGTEPPASLQALVLACMLSAVISLPEENVSMEFGVSKPQLLETFQKGTEAALYRANFLRSTKLQTLQAFVMYLIPLCRREVSRAHSAMTGMAIRLAECMGLHRDGSHYGFNAVETHVRRLLWHQLCFLDLRTCEATGPRPQIHRDDFDTKFPLNVNDADLERENPPTEDADYWTDSTFVRIRFEATELHRWVWFERIRLERKRTTLTAILLKVKNFISATEARYLPMLDKRRPLHYMAFLVHKTLTMRMYIMSLHKMASNGSRAMPDRLRRIMLSSGVSQVECAIIIETNPLLKPWAWYCGALHQYQTTLLLLTELYAAPERYHQDRIWKCLDFVFEMPEHIDRGTKARLILTEVMQKSFAYQNLRKVRAPKNLEERLALQQQMSQASLGKSGGGDYGPPLPSSASASASSVSPPQHPQHPQSRYTSTTTRGRSDSQSQQQQQQQQQQLQQLHQQHQQHQQQHSHPQSLAYPQSLTNVLQSNLPPSPSPSDFRHFTGAQQQQQQQHMHDAYGNYPPPASGFLASMPPRGTEVHMGGQQHGLQALQTFGAGGRSSASPADAVVDIDWNEWDRLFPPDLPIGDLSMPDFQFDTGTTYFAPAPGRR